MAEWRAGCIRVHHYWLTPLLGPQALIRHERCTYIHNYNKVKLNIRGSGVSSLCVPQGAGELPRRPAMSHGTEHQYFRITALWCVCVYSPFVALYPSCHLHFHCPTAILRPATVQYHVYMCTYLCLRVPARLAQHLERISVPLFCSHCFEWAKGGQVQGSTGSCFIFPFISILTLPCNHPHRLFSMPRPITRETVGRGKPGDGLQYKNPPSFFPPSCLGVLLFPLAFSFLCYRLVWW